MKKFTQHLGEELSQALKTADELWVAVALMTRAGLQFIEDHVAEAATQNYVLGTDLPTDPAALAVLQRKQFSTATKVAMNVDRAFYHPKVYIIRSGKKLLAFVGSANCTKSGLAGNVELSFIVEDQTACKELLAWYQKIEAEAVSLTSGFIAAYRPLYERRKSNKREDERIAKQIKQQLEAAYTANMASRSKLIDVLQAYRKGDDYNEMKADRALSVRQIRKSLDYPDFRDIDLDAFFGLWALGHLIPIPKPRILAELPKFRRLLQLLTNEELDVAERYDEALTGDLAMYGVRDALISKVLTIHNPKKYFIKNGKSDTTLQNYGLELPRGISAGEKYKATCAFLIDVCKDSGIDDLAVLDYYLYLEAEE
ncbi:MAG: hypothetical protein C7N36_21490 [Bacteroidetes bacterium]|nr:MAG: hypothetical protein C7N36_21490 [Bacteroidota bacterium]